MRHSVGLFMPAITVDMAMAAADFAMAIAIQNLLWGFIQPLVGALADKYGTRWIGIAGAILFAIGFTITATASSTLEVWLGTGVVVGIALACSSTSIAAKIAARAVRPERWSYAFGIEVAANPGAPLAQAAA